MTVDLRMMMSSKLGLLSPLAEGVASSWKRSVSVPESYLLPLFGWIKNGVISTLIEVFILLKYLCLLLTGPTLPKQLKGLIATCTNVSMSFTRGIKMKQPAWVDGS